MARKGAKADDFQGYAVLKSGLVDKDSLQPPGTPPERAIGFILSNANLDREGDSIAVTGWDISDYENNPVVLWAHLHDQLPLAKAAKTYVDGINLKAIDVFANEDLYPFADTVYRMLQQGFLNACSVGFQPSEWDMSETGVAFMKQSLLEHSVCPVPAHPEALVIARSKGINTAPLRAWAEATLDQFRRSDQPGTVGATLRKQLENLRVQADPNGRKLFVALSEIKLPASLPGEEVDLAAIPLLKDEPPPAYTPPAAPAAPAAPATDPSATPSAELQSLQTMSSLMTQVGTAASMATEAINSLIDTPTPGGEQPAPALADADEAAGDRELLSTVVANAQTAVEALTQVGMMAQNLLQAIPAPAPAPAVGAPAPAAAAPVLVPVQPSRAWNSRWSKAFDVSRVRLDAQTVELALVGKYLGVELKHVECRRTMVPAFRMGSWLTAIDEEVHEWSVDDIRNLTWDGKETPPVYEVIDLNSKLKSDFLVDGLRFMRQGPPANEMRSALRVEPNWYGIDITVYGLRTTGVASKMLSTMSTTAKSINFLKGEAFALCGEFLPKTGETFGDLFLSKANETAATRVVRLVNERGIALENRGVLLMGPPGTGKTLLARIMRNEAEATFMWISSRDFHYAGAFGGITEAFDLARECAPSILVFEDIDNWLGSTTIDLLKTEMDGVGRSTGVVTLMTTNYPEMLPTALLDRPGRFHDVLRFGLPDATVRRSMLKKWLPELDDVTALKAVTATDGYSGAHIRELCRFAGIIGEQEAVELAIAVERALVKLAEQRELINLTQSQGSRYRAAEDLVIRKARLRASEPGLQALPVVEKGTAGGTDDARDRLFELSTCAATLLAGDLSAVNRSKVLQARRELHAAQLSVVKIGRVLSAANEDRIRKAGELLKEVLVQLESAPPEEGGDGGELPKPKPEEFLLLEEEAQIDVPDVDVSMIRETMERVVRDQIMTATGRVD